MLALIMLTLLAHALAQNTNCDFSQYAQPGITYDIASPNYNASYPRGAMCRWIATCPTGYQIRLDCLLEMPLTSGCTGDKIYISRSGDPQFNNADTYCGRGQLTGVLSVGQALSVFLSVTSNSPGGRFRCDLTLQATPPPQQTCRCGITRRNRIVGGTNAGTNEYPMMAALIEVNSDRRPMCGGAIISSTHIMTAAHCLDNQSPSRLFVNIGSSRVRLGQNYTIATFSIHPNYNSATYDYDIALLRLQREIVFNDNIIPVCLPFKFRNVNLSGRYVTLLGWGTLFIGGPTPDVLQKVDVQLISQQQCQSSETVTSRQLCNLTPGKDACQMDSGGPALYSDPQSGLQMCVGIISFGRSCASNSPGILTRVTELLDWITRTAPAQYCSVP